MRITLVPGRGIAPQRGGQGSFCRYLSEGLSRLGHRVTIVSNAGWSSTARDLGVELVASLAPALARADILHVNGPGVRAAAAGTLSRRPVVLTHQDYRCLCPARVAWTPQGCDASASTGPCRGCPGREPGPRLRTIALRTIAGRCANVAVSAHLHFRLGLPRGVPILSPVAASPALASGEDGLLAFAGRLVPEKGLETLLRAAASLPRVRVEIAGGGPLRAAWADLARELGLAQRVRFVGELTPDGVRDLYSRADIVCVPSIWGEPFGYSAAEAMAMGRPVAASDCGALPELVGDGRGWLCRAGDPEDWAAKLTQALGNPGERQRRGSRAREFACTRLAPAHVARQYVSVYESVLGAAGTPHHHAGRA